MIKLSKVALLVLTVAVAAALVLSFVALRNRPVPAPVTPNFGAAQINTNIDAYVSGVQIGDRVTNWKSGTIGRGSNQASWKNTTGRRVYVDLFYARTTGTASSTFTLTVGTSTTATVTNSATPLSTPTLIDAYSIATSSGPRTINSIKDAGTAGTSVISVADGQYVLAALENPYRQDCTGAVCENATSTNRGFNLDWAFRYSYIQ